MIRRINLFGGPGCGKSTMASGVFSQLKILGYSVELVVEYIKTWAYEKRKLETFDQLYIFAKQQRLEDRVLRLGVNHVVSDSPLFLQCFYAAYQGHMCSPELLSITQKFEVIYPSLNFFVKRNAAPYKTEGRYETEEQAKQVDAYMKTFLLTYSIPFIEIENANDIVKAFTTFTDK